MPNLYTFKSYEIDTCEIAGFKSTVKEVNLKDGISVKMNGLDIKRDITISDEANKYLIFSAHAS